MLHDPSIAASTQTAPCVGDPSSSGGRGAGLTSLPCWANTAQGRALITAIKAEKPTIDVYDDGLSAWNGRRYNGRNAAQLRALFDRTYAAMLDWVAEARADVAPGRAQPLKYHVRRDAVVEWAREFGPDRLISKILGDA